jgi:hypothetical protein
LFYFVDHPNCLLLENWCNERRKKSYFKNQNIIEPENKTDLMKYENVHGTSNEKIADNLLEKAWINDDPKYIKELITLIESKKLNGNTFTF